MRAAHPITPHASRVPPHTPCEQHLHMTRASSAPYHDPCEQGASSHAMHAARPMRAAHPTTPHASGTPYHAPCERHTLSHPMHASHAIMTRACSASIMTRANGYVVKAPTCCADTSAEDHHCLVGEHPPAARVASLRVGKDSFLCWRVRDPRPRPRTRGGEEASSAGRRDGRSCVGEGQLSDGEALARVHKNC